MRVLVTGCAGFIGSHLCERLLRDGHSVTGYDNFDPYYDPEVKRRHVLHLQEHAAFAFCEGDIRDESALESLWRQFDPERVVHLAARAGVRASLECPALYADVNVTGTAVILEKARQASTPVIFASSSSVYGESATAPFSENEADSAIPVSPYAATKRAGELLGATFHHLYGVPLVCLRLFSVYGPRQRPDMAIGRFVQSIYNNEPITLYGDGSMARDYTFIDDIVAGFVAAIERVPELGYGVVNLGNSRPVSLHRLVSALEEASGRKAKIEWAPVQPGDVPITCADLTRAHEFLGYDPAVSLEEGLLRTVQWFESR